MWLITVSILTALQASQRKWPWLHWNIRIVWRRVPIPRQIFSFALSYPKSIQAWEITLRALTLELSMSSYIVSRVGQHTLISTRAARFKEWNMFSKNGVDLQCVFFKNVIKVCHEIDYKSVHRGHLLVHLLYSLYFAEVVTRVINFPSAKLSSWSLRNTLIQWSACSRLKCFKTKPAFTQYFTLTPTLSHQLHVTLGLAHYYYL